MNDRFVVVLLTLVDFESDLRHRFSNAGIFTLFAREGGKTGRAENQIGGHAVGDRELRGIHRMNGRAPAHAVDERVDDDENFSNLVSLEAIFGHEIVDGIDRRMGRAAGGVRLDGHSGEFPVFA